MATWAAFWISPSDPRVCGAAADSLGTWGGGGGAAGWFSGALSTGVVLGSVLVHELGHAFAARAYGLGPVSIVLHGFGGLTRFGHRPTHKQGVVVGLAGPFAGLALGLVALPLSLWGGLEPGWLSATLESVVRVNLFWSVFNLLPMYPLDGGQVLWHVLAGRIDAFQARLWVRRVSLASAALVGLFGIVTGIYFLALICFFVWRQNQAQ